ncbi:MAG: hypothetical protein IIU45_02905, partial [Lachnospiraceae bacterium]|nr:hypothetical protein [Lachnospiraceae bacterium]
VCFLLRVTSFGHRTRKTQIRDVLRVAPKNTVHAKASKEEICVSHPKTPYTQKRVKHKFACQKQLLTAKKMPLAYNL